MKTSHNNVLDKMQTQRRSHIGKQMFKIMFCLLLIGG